MVVEVIMPKMGQTMEKGKIVKWLKKEGERVEKGEPLLEIETDKTTIEVEARASGILKKILAREGEELPIATTIAYIGGEDEPLPEGVGGITNLATAQLTAEAFREQPKVGDEGRIKVSPLARKIAEEKGVDLTNVKGTGPDGRITKEDVLAYLASMTAPPVSIEKAPAAPSSEYQLLPMSSMRKAIARKMTESKMHVPHFYVSVEIDMTEAAKLRDNLMPMFEAKAGTRLSFTHMIIKAVAMALKEYPQLNSTINGENIKIWREINIGIAVSLDDGLLVPVLRGADKMDLFKISQEADRLITRAREKKLREEEFSGGTFTISNMGTLGVESFIAIINIPETAILATGRISDKPVVLNGQIAIRKIMNATLSVDHRVVDGAVAAKFLNRIKQILEAPYNLLIPG
ncbi:MAG: dihydrolipoamide acetyltransferase family protein [Nitrososphaerota archaeon]|nr:2-oxo acid dehydrogenase subunit E2 [Candidatus Bathyarchaeota archaeon]MDW8048683.1 dihydrolipoamide acetyltransferase family protein [Nitrososphaerota archaeon]